MPVIITQSPQAYDLNKVFQVFGHSRLGKKLESILSDNLAMIDSAQCFMIDEDREEKIETILNYEKS